MVSKSPERHTFQRDSYIKRCEEEGRVPDPSILAMYVSWAEEDEYENRPENDLEYDLRTTEWVLAKARAREDYAQNIYAAMCNMRWQRLDAFPILKDEYWSCSWRAAGGLVAGFRNTGDYLDWYCSGIQDFSSDEADPRFVGGGYVAEGAVTDEVLEDFKILGWAPSPWPKDDK